MATDAFDCPSNHNQREEFIRRKLPGLWNDFNYLQTRSTRARYHPEQPKPTAEQLARYEAEQFARIVAEVRSRGISL
jgi:hypothetical protein